jgi:Tfp pilus assembly protein PilX
MMTSNTEKGVVMVIALIMLAVVTLIGTVSANLVMGNLRIVQNIEARASAKSGALSAMQEAIMTNGFLEGEKAFNVSCKGDSYTRCFDMTGNLISDDMSVTLSKPRCISAIPVRNSTLKVWQDPDDASCYQPGVYSLCADALWEVTMTAADPVTGAKVVVRQGLTTRTSVNLIAAACG